MNENGLFCWGVDGILSKTSCNKILFVAVIKTISVLRLLQTTTVTGKKQHISYPPYSVLQPCVTAALSCI